MMLCEYKRLHQTWTMSGVEYGNCRSCLGSKPPV